MINFISGPVGSGKTQKLIEMANNELSSANGLIVYIDKSTKHRLAVDNQIRFINAKEFAIESAEGIFGFLCGLISGNYDINRVFIDNIGIMANVKEPQQYAWIFNNIKALAEEHKIQFYITLNSDDVQTLNLNEFM